MTKLNYDIEQVKGGMTEIHFNQKMLNRKFESHYQSTKKHNRNITFYSILETVMMSIILLVQLYYIKNLIEKS